MFYSSQPEELRAFLRDKLNLPFADVGEGWLIFDLPEAEMGCHPADASGDEGSPAGTHHISFYCDDVQRTVKDLKKRGVEFIGLRTLVGSRWYRGPECFRWSRAVWRGC